MSSTKLCCRKSLLICLTLLLLIPGSVFAREKLGAFAEKNAGKKLAVVTLSANNWGNSLQGWNSANTSSIMGTQLNSMLEFTEQLFAADFTVIPASQFVPADDFQALAGEQRDVGLPEFNGKKMQLLSKDRKQLIKATVDKNVTQKLAQITGADYLLLIYSEWTVATGKFVPTSKSLTKNVVSIIDANGKTVYSGRQDTQGNKTLGGMGSVVVNNDTIGEWVVAYEKALRALYEQGHKKK